MRVARNLCRLRTLVAAASLVAVAAASGAAIEAGKVASQDGYVISSRKGVWKLGTARAEKSLTLKDGKFLLTSFINKGAKRPREYIQGAPSVEFAITCNGALVTGGDGGWQCDDSSSKRLPQGELQLTVSLFKGSLGVTKHYVVYPGTGLIREWATYRNIGQADLPIGNPSFLETTLMSDDIKSGMEFGYFTGGAAGLGTQRLVTQAIDSNFSKTLSTTASIGHLPMMILFSTAERHGVTVGWDYLGAWAAAVGAPARQPFHIGLLADGYNRVLKPGESIDSPKAFVMAFAGDLDDMGNQVLDWQYRYLWQYKKPDYFARPRIATDFDAPWNGRGGTEDCYSRRLAMDLYFTDLARYSGAGVLWDDAGWYDEWGSWNGPDWSQTRSYASKHGMAWMLWFSVGLAYPGSTADRDLGPLITASGAAAPSWIDESQSAAVKWQLDLLNERAARWGGFQWRYDFLSSGRDQLEADAKFRSLNRDFLSANRDCAIDACCGGGMWIGYELAAYANSGSITDGGVRDYGGYYTSMLIPPDILNYSAYTQEQGRKNYSIYNDRIQLRTNPVWYTDPGSTAGYQSGQGNLDYRAEDILAVRPQSIRGLESIRRDWDLYKYCLSQEVAGRWCHVFRPKVDGDDPVLYFQRMDRKGTKGVVLSTRPYEKPESLPPGAVTVYPKGLLPDLKYDMRFDFSSDVLRRTGRDLMQEGIVLARLKPGEIIYLNLPNHPGSGMDKSPPSPPSDVTKRVGSNIFTQGVEIAWKPGSDDNWLSCYEVFRIGADGKETNLGKVSQGTFYFDRTAAATELIDCRYEIRSVDGDGNTSQRVQARLTEGEPETHYGFAGYGSKQGFRGWSYELTRDTKSYRQMYWTPANGYEGQWTGEQGAGVIGRTFARPHPSDDVARVFTVTRAGRVTLRGHVKKDMMPGLVISDDCRVRVLKNDQQIWPAEGWQSVPVNREGVSYEFTVDVTPGDRIVHVLQHNPNGLSADIAWNPTMQYER